jgi:hypothetical protein
MTVEEIEIIIKGNVDDAVSKIEGLKTKINSALSQAVKPIQQVNATIKSSGITQNLQKISNDVNTATNSASKQMEILSREIEMQQKKMQGLTKEYEYQKNILGGKLFEKYGPSAEMEDTADKIKKAQIQLDKMKLRYENLSNKTIPDVEKATKKATKSTNILAKVFNRMFVMMAIRTVVKQTIKGFNDLTQYSAKFNKTMSNLQASFIQVRNSTATAFAPALQALEPIITRISNGIANMFEQLAMWNTALFTNSKTYIRAKKVTTDYAKSVNDLKRSLAGFDEINVLGEQGQQGLPTAQEMFETVNIPEDVLTKANRLKEIWQEYKPLIIGITGALAGMKLGSEIDKVSDWISKLFGAKKATKGLTDSMLDKNNALQQQTKDTQTETAAVKSMIPALASAGAEVGIFSNLLNETNANEMIPQLQNADVEITTFAENTEESTSKIKTSFTKMLENLKIITPQIATQLEEQDTNTEKWSLNIGKNVKKAMVPIIAYTSGAFNSAGSTIAKFINSSSKNFANWCNNLTSNIGTTMQGWYETFTSSLESAWDAFTGFMAGIGEKISNWWSGAKKWVIPAAMAVTGVAVVAGAIPSGGASLMLLPALADGGVLTSPTPVLAGEYPGAKSNPEIVTPQNLMYETNLKANVPVLNAIEEMTDRLTESFSNVGVYAEFEYDKMIVGLDNAKRKRGAKLYGV